tara:strand:+ start:45309 stop:45881 length:573 start_codon:yes stop_codon:yes gene_type:complete
MYKVGEDILKDVKEDHHFYLLSGKTLKNLHELHNELENMDEHVFKHHVNQNKNDFRNWIRDVHQDEKLSKALHKIIHRNQALKVVRDRINEVNAAKIIGRIPMPPPQKRAISTGTRFSFMNYANKFQAVAGLVAALFLVAFVGIGLKSNSVTGAAVSSGNSGQFAFFGGILGVLFLLGVALYVINEKHGS